MSVTKSLFGTTRIVPQVDETGWGPEVTGMLEDAMDGLDDTTLQLSNNTVVSKENSVASSLAASATLTALAEKHVVTGSGGAVTLSATTAILDGSTDQVLRLIGGSDTNTVTILNGANTAMNGHITLALNDSIEFWFNGTLWVEKGRST